MSAERLYDEPRYYDIAFDWDIEADLGFLAQVFARFGRRQIQSVIELGCGTGLYLVGLAGRGYSAAGLDISRPMLDYARAKVAARALPVELFLKDMVDFSLFRKFDAAVCLRNTLSYLNPADRAGSHLRHVAQHLAPGGVYVIDLLLAPAGVEPVAAPQVWSAGREQIRVDARWELIGPWDQVERTTTERLTLAGSERGWQRIWEQESTIRVYSLPELRALAEQDGYFTLAAAYQGYNLGRELELAGDTGEGRTLVVLVRTEKPTPRPEGADTPFDAPRREGGRGLKGGRNRRDSDRRSGDAQRPPRRNGQRSDRPVDRPSDQRPGQRLGSQPNRQRDDRRREAGAMPGTTSAAGETAVMQRAPVSRGDQRPSEGSADAGTATTGQQPMRRPRRRRRGVKPTGAGPAGGAGTRRDGESEI